MRTGRGFVAGEGARGAGRVWPVWAFRAGESSLRIASGASASSAKPDSDSDSDPDSDSDGRPPDSELRPPDSDSDGRRPDSEPRPPASDGRRPDSDSDDRTPDSSDSDDGPPDSGRRQSTGASAQERSTIDTHTSVWASPTLAIPHDTPAVRANAANRAHLVFQGPRSTIHLALSPWSHCRARADSVIRPTGRNHGHRSRELTRSGGALDSHRVV